MVGAPSRSRRMFRPAWRGAQDEEEARAHLQSRLLAYTRMMFWSFIALLAFLAVLYHAYPDKKPVDNDIIFGGSAVMLAIMAAIWRLMLVRRQLSIATLNALDIIYAVGIGGSFGASAALAPELKPSAYTSLIFCCFTVFTRALVIPSTGKRTTVVASLALLPILLAAIYLSNVEDIPPGGFIGGTALISSVAVLLATTGSNVIYGLNRKVTEMMQLGQYTLEREIGQGGMGKVYRARHRLLRRPTAVKLLNPDKVGADNIDRFEREVQIMSQLTHPNTVAVFDYGRNPDNVFYYAMEYLGGGINLEDLVKTYGRQHSTRVAHILAQVCGALQEAHDAGLVHRDIKPGNIMLCERGGIPDIAKVLDFGLVKSFTADTSNSGEVVLGTAAYLAPEVLLDPAAVGPPVDLYAVGAVGYFLLTGKRMFEGKTSIAQVIQHVTNAPRRPSALAPGIDPAVEELILQCLAKSPAERPPSAAAVAQRLRQVPQGAGWDEDIARTWWREYSAVAARQPPTSTEPTRTITVDLHHRDD